MGYKRTVKDVIREANDKKLTEELLSEINNRLAQVQKPTWHFDSSACLEEYTVVINSDGVHVATLNLDSVPDFVRGAKAMVA